MSYPSFPYRPFDRPVRPPSIDGGRSLCVSFDEKWLPYLVSVITTLVVEGSWSSDVERATGEAQNLLRAFVDARECVPNDSGGPSAHISDEAQMELRFCGGKLQFCDCGVWTDVPSCDGTGQTTGGGAQPGGGTPQPKPGGGQQRYCGSMSGNSKWLLPTGVSTGDVLLFDDLFGAWHDSRELFWACPDGYDFVFGNCVQTPIDNLSGDPLVGTQHMSIVADIAGTFYDVLNLGSDGAPRPFTVPAGIDNAPVLLQANTDYTAEIDGEVSFCVQITDNQFGPWTSTFDFTINPYSSVIVADVGTWSIGNGYDGTTNGAVAFYAQLHVDVTTCHITSMQAIYDDDGPNGSGPALLFQVNGSAYGAGQTPTVASDQLLGIVGDAAGATQLLVVVDTGVGGGPCRLKKWTIQGIGPKPPELP